MSIYDTLKKTGLPCAYSHFRKPVEPPYIVYLGAGQQIFGADNDYYTRENEYTIEYYYETKDEEQEAAIEQLLLNDGFHYTKSDDNYIDTEGLFVIYYTV